MSVLLQVDYLEAFEHHCELIMRLVGLRRLEKAQEQPENAAKVVTHWGTFALILEQKELSQEEKQQWLAELERLNQHIASAEQKLQNERFMASAPAPVIDGVRKLLQENQQKKQSLEELLKKCVF